MAGEVDVTVRGHVGHDPTIFKRDGRRSFVRLNVASTPRIRTREGEWTDGATQWFAVKMFGDLAQNAGLSIRKGDAVLVRGRLEHEEYDTRDGERRWTAVIVAEAFGPDLRNATAHVSRNVRRFSAAEEPVQDGDANSAGASGSEHAESAEPGESGGPAASDESAEPGDSADSGVDTSAFQAFPSAEATDDEDATGEPPNSEETIAAKIA